MCLEGPLKARMGVVFPWQKRLGLSIVGSFFALALRVRCLGRWTEGGTNDRTTSVKSSGEPNKSLIPDQLKL
jgi:hypothetical protein